MWRIQRSIKIIITDDHNEALLLPFKDILFLRFTIPHFRYSQSSLISLTIFLFFLSSSVSAYLNLCDFLISRVEINRGN